MKEQMLIYAQQQIYPSLSVNIYARKIEAIYFVFHGTD